MRSCMLGLIESFYCFFQSLVFGPFDKRLEMVHFINIVDCSIFVVVVESMMNVGLLTSLWDVHRLFSVCMLH